MGLGGYGNGWKMYEIWLDSSSHLPFERLERKCTKTTVYNIIQWSPNVITIRHL